MVWRMLNASAPSLSKKGRYRPSLEISWKRRRRPAPNLGILVGAGHSNYSSPSPPISMDSLVPLSTTLSAVFSHGQVAVDLPLDVLRGLRAVASRHHFTSGVALPISAKLGETVGRPRRSCETTQKH
nr:hypothetical protein CFP56_76092 [Quercus suber]